METKASATITAIIISAILGTVVFFVNTRDREEVCSSKGCVNAAARILNSMDTSADPCEDFFQYTCGGWIDANPIPDDRAEFVTHHFIADVNEETLRDALGSDDTADRDAVKKVKTFYRTCMDEEALERLGAQPALDFIVSLGGMPMFGDAFDEKNFSLESEMASSLYTVLVGIAVTMDAKHSTRHTIVLDQPSLGMAKEYYFEPEFNDTLFAYRQFMLGFLEALWKSKDESEGKSTYDRDCLEEGVDEILGLEKELAEGLESMTNRLDLTELYMKFSLEEMSRNISAEFNWFEYAEKKMSIVNYTVTPDATIVSYGTPYFTKFMPIVKKYSNRALRNYIIWMNVHNLIGVMPDRFQETSAVYRINILEADSTFRSMKYPDILAADFTEKATTGTAEVKPRWRRCMTAAYNYFGLPYGAIFIENMFSEESKSQVVEMLRNIVKYFRQNLQALAWMDEETTTAALSKVDSLGHMIAYPDYIMDKENPKLDEEFGSLEITEGEYYNAELLLWRFTVEKFFSKITKPVLRYEWDFQGPSEVNAYYNLVKNLMVFPAGYIQPPFFDEYQPFAMNYGAIGSTIGHEGKPTVFLGSWAKDWDLKLTHGYDNRGSLFNAEGNLENWWSNFSLQHFNEKAQCVRDQYSGFYFDVADMFVNGNLTLSENIADLAGTRVAYEGYKLWQKTSGKRDFKLPGLEHFTSDQLFYISYGMNWCGSVRKEKAQNQIKTNVHSPSIFRTNGVVMNLPTFGQAFQCKKGEDKLFPETEKTCTVW